MQKYRVISFIVVHILIFIHVLWFQNSSLGSFDFQEFFDRFLGKGVLNAGSIMVILAFLLTLVFGRFFCGWMCHFGAVQEFAWWVFSKFGIKPKTINSRLIAFLPLFILFHFYIIPHFNIENFSKIEVDLSTPNVWAFLPGIIIGSLTFIIDGFLIVYLLGRKGFCRFVCPWGAFLKIPTVLSTFKVRKTGDCTHCNMCTSGCPIAIDVSYEINQFNKVINSNCTSCMICIDDCPENALSYKFASPTSDFDDVRISDFSFQKKSFIHSKIKNLFISLRSKDLFIIPLAITFGWLLTELYHIGHLLAFGIAAIISLVSFNQSISKKIRIFIICGSLIFMSFNGFLKYSKYMGRDYLKNQKFEKAIPLFENIINYYPIEKGKYHAYLSECYLGLDKPEKALEYFCNACSIIPPNNTMLDTMSALLIEQYGLEVEKYGHKLTLNGQTENFKDIYSDTPIKYPFEPGICESGIKSIIQIIRRDGEIDVRITEECGLKIDCNN